MFNKRSRNKRLDTIAKRLFEVEKTDAGNIDAIISNPELYSLVRAKIILNAGSDQATRSWMPGVNLNRQNILALSAAAVILITISIIGAASLFRSETNLVTSKNVKAPEATPDVARPGFPPNPSVDQAVGKLSVGRALSNIKTTAVAEPAAARPRGRRLHEPQGEFYALSTADDTGDQGGDSRVIRVEMPRSSLFALGANVPLENGPEVVKADLLIGPDGTTRAIRVVK